MSSRSATENPLGEFLRARRALVRPADVGVPELGRRRVPGLRREEAAMLAGVSVDYYVRLEQGRERHPSEQVLDAIARALQLGEDAIAHLHALARPPARRRRTAAQPERVSSRLRSLLDAWSHTPAVVLGRRMDVLAANALAGAVHPGFSAGRNLTRVVFLDPASRETYVEWEAVAANAVAALRAAAGRDPDDPRMSELVGELTLKSDEFRRLWSRHDVREKTSGTKRFNNPLVGELTLDYETFIVSGTAAQRLCVYHAEPGSRTAQALSLLESIVAEQEPVRELRVSATEREAR